jgi:hypothetical protein
MRHVALAVVLAGCGRFSFDPLSDPSGSDAGDARPSDAPRMDAAPIIHDHPPNVVVLGTLGASVSTMWDALVTARAQNRASITGSTTINDVALAQAEVVIVMAPQKVYSAAESAAIQRVVARGGGLIVTSGYDTDTSLFDATLVAFNVQGVGMADLNGPVTTLGSHPITAGVSQLPFIGGHAMTTTRTVAPLGTISGQLVGCGFDEQLGRVVLWGDEQMTFDANWNTNTQTFWDNAFTWVWPQQ